MTSPFLDKPIRTREEYLIEKMKSCTMTQADWHEWLNMPYDQMTPIRSVRDDMPEKPPVNIRQRQIEARRWARE
jgi:hypothetical protein